MIQYRITNERVGNTTILFGDYSARVQGLTFATNKRGFAECACFIPMSMGEAFALQERLGTLRVQVADSSSGAVYDGRVEDIGITGEGVSVTALGFSRALGDAPYTALWSSSDVTAWRPIQTTEVPSRFPEMYQMDTNNRLLITLTKGTAYGTGNHSGSLVFQKPEGGSRQIIGISFDMVTTLPINWVLRVIGWQTGFTAGVVHYTYTGTGGTVSFGQLVTFAVCDYVEVGLLNSTGALYTNTFETGVQAVRLNNTRLVTATTNMVSTTLTVALTSAEPCTATVGSTARMYVGQRIYIGTAPASIGATIASIISATQFTTNIPAAVGVFPIGTTVKAFVVYADEIAKNLVSVTNTLNSNQLSSSTVLVTSPAVDLIDESYEDQRPADVLDYLTTLGDTAGNTWEWGVKADQRLYYRVLGSGVRTWYIDVSNLDIRQILDNLYNSVYAVYQSSDGRSLRATASSDTASVARFGLTRRLALSVSSTSTAQAALQQATALNDGKNPRPQSGVTVDRVFDASGSQWPLWYVSAGDTVIIRNLPPTLSTTIDRVRSFRLARVEYSFETNTLTLEPETPVPSLDSLLARGSAPNWVAEPWWVQVHQK